MNDKCEHSEDKKSIVVIEAFDIYEKTQLYCSLCKDYIENLISN